MASSPAASPSEGPRRGDLITFEAVRPGRSDHDVFLYNPKLDEVLELAAAGSQADEVGPYLAADNTLLIFQRTRGDHSEVVLLHLASKRFDTLGVTQFEDWVDTGEEYLELDAVTADRQAAAQA